jgi:hypothetical protein
MVHSSTTPGARAVLCSLVLLGACNGAQQQDDRPDAATAPSVDASVSCPKLPSAVSGAPSTIADAVALVNALVAQRSPISVDCFVSALDRPLTVLGAISTFSLQPSVNGALNPRIFIFSGNLVMSVVSAGEASAFIELAEYTTPVRSIKAQLAFPVIAPVQPGDPYDSVHTGAGTVCGGCHGSEQAAAQITAAQAFESNVLQPLSTDVVPLPQMQADMKTCDPQQEPDRCAILNALFSRGEVRTGAFSPDARTIFD